MNKLLKLSGMSCLGAIIALVVGTGVASAVTYQIDWLDMSPTAVNSTVPNGSIFNVAGIGNVTINYTVPASWTHVRGQLPIYATGSVVYGPHTFNWNNFEYFSTIFADGELGPENATITYTFPSVLPSGTVYVGTVGLGATTSFGGGYSSTTVPQTGTFLGEFIGDPTAGASLFTGGPGSFTVQNSVTGAGGINPWWNTNLAVVVIDDPVSSLTINQSMIRGDGIGVTIGFVRNGSVDDEATSWGSIKSLFR